MREVSWKKNTARLNSTRVSLSRRENDTENVSSEQVFRGNIFGNIERFKVATIPGR